MEVVLPWKFFRVVSLQYLYCSPLDCCGCLRIIFSSKYMENFNEVQNIVIIYLNVKKTSTPPLPKKIFKTNGHSVITCDILSSLDFMFSNNKSKILNN